MAFAFKPTDANTLSVAYGVANELSGDYIIQNEDITENTSNLEISDQKGRVAQVIAYDKGMNVSITAIGDATPPCRVGDTLSWKDVNGGSQNYIINNVRRSCVYNDTAKWIIDGTAYLHASYYDKTEEQL